MAKYIGRLNHERVLSKTKQMNMQIISRLLKRIPITITSKLSSKCILQKGTGKTLCLSMMIGHLDVIDGHVIAIAAE